MFYQVQDLHRLVLLLTTNPTSHKPFSMLRPVHKATKIFETQNMTGEIWRDARLFFVPQWELALVTQRSSTDIPRLLRPRLVHRRVTVL